MTQVTYKSTNYKLFGSRIIRWANTKAPGIALENTKQLMLEAAFKAIDMSPVKTGHFVWNWQLVRLGTRPPEIPGVDPLRTEVVARVFEQSQELMKSRVFKMSLVNMTPYAGALDKGSSAQAPAGILRLVAAHLKNGGGR